MLKTAKTVYQKAVVWAYNGLSQKSFYGSDSTLGLLSYMAVGDFRAFSLVRSVTEGTQKNPIVARCIKKRATEISNIKIVAKDSKGNILPEHDSLTLLNRPNNRTTRSTLLEALVTYRALAGDAYLFSTSSDVNKPPAELFILRPDMVIVNTDGTDISSYRYQAHGGSMTVEVDKITGASNIMHWQNFNPLSTIDGQPLLTPAQSAIEMHNKSQQYNNALLDNQAVPSGALTFTSKDGDVMSPTQRDTNERALKERHTGAKNAGKIMLLDGKLTFAPMSMSTKDMDYIKGKNSNARDICIATGIPADLILGGSTYDNRSADMQAMYEDTIIPELRSLLDQLNIWLMPRYKDGVYLDMDVSEVAALAPRRKETMEMYELSNSVTINEKRTFLSFEPVNGGDDLYVQTGMIPLSLVNASAQAGLDSVVAMSEDGEKSKKKH